MHYSDIAGISRVPSWAGRSLPPPSPSPPGGARRARMRSACVFKNGVCARARAHACGWVDGAAVFTASSFQLSRRPLRLCLDLGYPTQMPCDSALRPAPELQKRSIVAVGGPNEMD